MLGRRSYKRYRLVPAADGVLRVLGGVVVQWTNHNEWTAISREAGTVGEILMLDLGGGESPVRYGVRVIDSRPVMIEGAVRHQLRLRVEDVAPEGR
jgi:hypothetical protein